MGGGGEGHYPAEYELNCSCTYLLPSLQGEAAAAGGWEGLLVGATVRPLHWLLAPLSVCGCGDCGGMGWWLWVLVGACGACEWAWP